MYSNNIGSMPAEQWIQNVLGILITRYEIDEQYTENFINSLGSEVNDPLFLNKFYAGYYDKRVIDFVTHYDIFTDGYTYVGQISRPEYILTYKLYANVPNIHMSRLPFLVRDFVSAKGFKHVIEIKTLVKLVSTQGVLELAVKDIQELAGDIPVILEAGYLFMGDEHSDTTGATIDKLEKVYSKYFEPWNKIFRYESSRPMLLRSKETVTAIDKLNSIHL